MNRYLIDTNIISELVKAKPNKNAVEYIISLPKDAVYLSVITLGEIRKGVEKLPNSKRKLELVKWLDELVIKYKGKIIPVSLEVADKWGYLLALSNVSAIDALIAATALTHNLTLITRNVKDFKNTGVEIIDPFTN